MVGWLYIDEQVAAPIRLLEIDHQTGLITLEVAAKFVPSRSQLRGQTIVEYRGWKRRRAVRCLGAEEVGSAMMIEAVDVGLAVPEESDEPALSGAPEDWLVVDGQARCQVRGVRLGYAPGSMSGHLLFHVPLDHWRDLRIGETAALACVGIATLEADANDGSITPLLHSARDPEPGSQPPSVELVRLRERMRYAVTPMATDWCENTTLVVCRVVEAEALGTKRPGKSTAQPRPAKA